MFKKLLYIGLTTLVISLFFVISGINYLMTNTDLFNSKNTEKMEEMVVFDTTKVKFVTYDTVKVKIQNTIPKPVTIVRDTIPTSTLDTIK
jgi:hypothetical protein